MINDNVLPLWDVRVTICVLTWIISPSVAYAVKVEYFGGIWAGEYDEGNISRGNTYCIVLLLLSAFVSARTPFLQSKPPWTFQTLNNDQGLYDIFPWKEQKKPREVTNKCFYNPTINFRAIFIGYFMSRGGWLFRNNPRLCQYLSSYDFYWKEAKSAEKKPAREF